MASKIRGKDLIKIGFPKKNNGLNIALGLINRYKKKENKEHILDNVKQILEHPEAYVGDPFWGKVVEQLIEPKKVKRQVLNTHKAPHHVFGNSEIKEQAKFQLYGALKLPIAVAGALMPDAHHGYGLPIGGVLATDNAVIPYGVGVDIGCRMHLSIFRESHTFFDGRMHQIKNVLRTHSKFGMKETHDKKMDHELFSDNRFDQVPLAKSLRDKAYKQLGTSGGGNHFVEFGEVEITDENNEFKLKPGKYFGLLSHSGSRGLGANIAKHYTQLAQKQCPLPREVQHLAWLDMNSHDGQEYWLVMNLAGDYAAACHENIHYRMAKALGLQVKHTVSNFHNFAWKQQVGDKECIVHRKGATPAKAGQLGIIPGSMTSSGYIVRGKGNIESLESASHGAGRAHSRSACKSTFTVSDMKKQLKRKDIKLIGGGIDECPQAYKDIDRVMDLQKDLVDVVGKFHPRIVRMA